ncbi:succinylglutamate desuccinylase/aspartoacylase family protein [Sporosarcina sp. FSL K6-2383]|uniref:succinylglutamate desuccinylase/aspartoacylase family protein n=1 Tax=Sporosarcina sp. FSL K6-2383 TaxID=2921556 RepID=UPI00315A6A4C
MGRTYEEIFVTHLSNGEKVTLPIHTIVGEKPGPVLGISAVIHGDEIIGAEIIRRIYNQIDESELSGTIMLLPVANSLAFESLTRNTPLDMNNLNRLFPGKEDGWSSEILAHSITKNFLDKVDHYIDLHAGGAVPIVDYVYIQNDEALSRAFNFPLLYRPTDIYEGTTATYTVAKGVPSVTVEIGGGPNYNEHVERGVQGIVNCLKHLQMIPGTAEKREDQVVLSEITIIRPKNGGMLVPEFDFEAVGQEIKGQQVLCNIYNPKTFDLIETIKTPYERNIVVLMRGLIGKVNPGDYGYMIGNLETAEPKA